MKKPGWVIVLMILMATIESANGMKLIPTVGQLDQWSHLVSGMLGLSLGLFGYPVVNGKGGGTVTPIESAKKPEPPAPTDDMPGAA